MNPRHKIMITVYAFFLVLDISTAHIQSDTGSGDIATAFAYGSSQVSETFRCDYTVRDACGAGENCSKIQSQQIRSQGGYLLIPSLATLKKAFPSAENRPAVVQRCDQKGCTPVEVWANVGSGFVNIWSTHGGCMLRLLARPLDCEICFDTGSAGLHRRQ